MAVVDRNIGIIINDNGILKLHSTYYTADAAVKQIMENPDFHKPNIKNVYLIDLGVTVAELEQVRRDNENNY